MDLNIINIPTLIILFIFVLLVVIHLYMSQHFGTLEALGIPCEKPWPIFGNIASELFAMTHEHDMEVYRKYGPIYGHYETRNPTIRITDTNILREVLVRQFPNFADRRTILTSTDPLVKSFLSVMKGEQWKQKRSLVTPIFTSGKLKQMAPLIEKCSIHLLKCMEEKSETGESFQAKDVFSKYLIDVIALCAFGLDMEVQVKDGEKFAKYARLMVAELSVMMAAVVISMPVFLRNWVFFPFMKQFFEGLDFFKKIAYKIVKMRQTNNEKQNDFLQIMLDYLKDEDEINETKGSEAEESNETKGSEAEESNETKVSEDKESNKPAFKKIFTVDDVAANAVTFMFGGFETTATTLSFIAHSLATNQDCQDKLIEEIDDILEKNEGKLCHDDVAQMQYMEMVIMETLRLYPVALRLDRMCLTTTKINDLVIPKGVIVIVPVYVIHYNEEFYPDPYRFDPQRFTPENKSKRDQFAYYGFGLGPRNCLGMRLALMMIKLTLANVLKNYRFICGPKTQVPLKFKKGKINLEPEDGFQIYVEKRSTAT